MIDYLHHYLPQPIVFQWGFIKLHYYGLFIVLGILLALSVTVYLGKKIRTKKDEIYDAAFFAVFSGLIGARLYAIFLNFDYYLQYPAQIFAIWRGGLAIHGAILGGLGAGAIYCWYYKKSFWLYADLAAPGLALAQAVGRWGNYFNQEVFGRPTDLAWGIPIEFANRPLAYLSSTHFHPTFLYESGLNLVNFLFLFWLFGRIYKSNNESGVKNNELRIKNIGIHNSLFIIHYSKNGLIFLVYLINYSVVRFLMEFLRTDETIEVLGIRWPQLLSVAVIIVSLAVIYHKLIKKPRRSLAH